MKARVKVLRTYEIEYQHKDHLEYITTLLENEHICDMGGAGFASNEEVYSYRCKSVGKGKVVK